MNCPYCKNPIEDNSTECEWCGNKTGNNISSTPHSSQQSQNLNVLDDTALNSRNKIKYFLPGLVVLLIWILGNLISERDKRALFSTDDLTPILILGLVFFGIGFITKLIKK